MIELNKTIRTEAAQLKQAMSKRRQPRATYKDLTVLIQAHQSGDYTAAHQTTLYRQHGGEYCEYLEIFADCEAAA